MVSAEGVNYFKLAEELNQNEREVQRVQKEAVRSAGDRASDI